jgi:single-stranded-DNA-specific exonuclease RecJ
MAEWVKKEVDKKLVKTIAEQYSCDILTAFILARRGIDDEEIPYFLSSGEDMPLHDPLLLPGMDDTVKRIRQALINKEKVLVFGDRDVDGITGTVLLTDYLQSLGIDVIWRIPIEDEPYGLSMQSVEDFASKNGSLIVTVDCGISSLAEIELAGRLGIDVIVTDHHTPKDILPKALVIVNPKLPYSIYPFPDISGCTVAYKLVCALQTVLESKGIPDFAQKEKGYIQLACLGAVGDIMPLRNENRLIVRRGLKLLMEKPRHGLSELLISVGLAGKRITTKELSWIVCPTINAAGRMGSPDKVVNLLLEKDPIRRIRLAGEIKSLNGKRQRLGIKTWPIIERLAQDSIKQFEGKLVVAASEAVSRGITGVMANRLIDYYHIPAMVVHLGKDLVIGSIRSPGNYDIRLLLEPMDDILLNYGGHVNALGFSLIRSLWSQFIDRLEIETGFILSNSIPDEVIAIDAELPHAYLTPDILAMVDLFEPYGTGNEPLVFASQGLKVLDSSFVGKKQPKHLKTLLDAGKYKWPAILWNAEENLTEEIKKGDTVDLVYNISRNLYRGIETPQLVIKDILIGDS